MRRAVPYAAIALCLADCGGGELHFTTGQTPAPVPTQPAPPPKHVLDSFLYAEATGDAIVVFDFNPLKTMKAARVGFLSLAGHFTQVFWSGAGLLEQTQIGVVRDVVGAEPDKWYAYSAGQSGAPQSDSKNYLQDEMRTMADDQSQGEGTPVTPVDGLLSFAGSISAPLELLHRPVWFHYVYLDNQDVSMSPLVLSQAATIQNDLRSSLDRDSLSQYRYRFYAVSGVGATACGGPVARELFEFMSAFQYESYEVCRLESPGSDGSVLEALAASMLKQQQRLVLSRPPILDTMQLQAAGRSIPRQWYSIDPSSNELLLTQAGAQGLNPGDPIEVTYETP